MVTRHQFMHPEKYPRKNTEPDKPDTSAGDEFPEILVACSNRMWAYPAPAFEARGDKSIQKYIRADKAMEICVERIMACEDLSINTHGLNFHTGAMFFRRATTAEVLALLNSKEKNGE